MVVCANGAKFPFLFGGTFIEGKARLRFSTDTDYFPSFSEGLSLRAEYGVGTRGGNSGFPFLFGGTFIEGILWWSTHIPSTTFPFLFGGTFIEGMEPPCCAAVSTGFPFLFGGTFIEGAILS